MFTHVIAVCISLLSADLVISVTCQNKYTPFF